MTRGESAAEVAARQLGLRDGVTFISIGDWGRAGMFGQTELAQVIGDWAAAWNAGFIVSVGDNFYDSGVTSADDPAWQRSWSDVYTHPYLADKKWYCIVGNHDYRGNLSAQIGWARDPRWYMPSLNYSVTWPLPRAATSSGAAGQPPADKACVHGVFVDTSPFISYYKHSPEKGAMPENLQKFGSNPGMQLRWMEEQLAFGQAHCSTTVVIGHHPVYSGALHGDNQELVRQFKPLLEQYGVRAYISGHDHTMLISKVDGVDYIISGAASEVRDDAVGSPTTTWFKNDHGFLVTSINATHILNVLVVGAGEVGYTSLQTLSTP